MGQYSDQLAQVNKAISAVMERGQRVEIKDRVLWRAELDPLLKERARLEPLAAREARGGGIRVRRIVPL